MVVHVSPLIKAAMFPSNYDFFRFKTFDEATLACASDGQDQMACDHNATSLRKSTFLGES